MKGKIFNKQEVQAIIAGTKTMFREVLKVQPTNENQVFSTVASSIRNKDIGTHNFINPKATWEQTKKFKCPYQVGQKIFVKESFSKLLIHSGHQYYYPAHCIRECVDRDNGFHYWADGNPEFGDWESPRPATHMKQEHSRLTLEITNIKVERLADISEGDAIKEGLDLDSEHSRLCLNIQDQPYSNDLIDGSAFKTIFAKNWNATHKKPEEKFEANPFVWVVYFKINK